MKKVLYIIVVVIVVLSVVGFGWKFVSKPDLNRIEEQMEDKYEVSEISYPENYRQLVAEEKKNNQLFLLHETMYCEVYENSFPYSKIKLDEEKTNDILEVLNDSTSYRWGEFGTPEYDFVIIYYGKNSAEIGYTLIDPAGEVENYPYRSVMKWGVMTDDGFEKLINGISEK